MKKRLLATLLFLSIALCLQPSAAFAAKTYTKDFKLTDAAGGGLPLTNGVTNAVNSLTATSKMWNDSCFDVQCGTNCDITVHSETLNANTADMAGTAQALYVQQAHSDYTSVDQLLLAHSSGYTPNTMTAYTLAAGNTHGEMMPLSDPPAHSHMWDTAWTTDDDYHWHECTAADCPITDNALKDGYAAHIPEKDDGSCSTPIICTVCNVVMTAAHDTWLADGNYSAEFYQKLYDMTEDMYLTEETALEVNTAAELAAFAKALDIKYDTFAGRYLRLTANLDMSAHLWVAPLMYGTADKIISIDGGGHTVSGLRIHAATDNLPSFGMFAATSYAYINNLILDKVSLEDVHSVTGDDGFTLGALVGVADHSAFNNCRVTNPILSISEVNGEIYAGGLLGMATYSELTGCYAQNGSISASTTGNPFDTYLGGLIGHMSISAVINCHTDVSLDAQVEENLYLGGISGYSVASPSATCLINNWSRGELKARGSVENAYIGGICGWMEDDGRNNYFAGSIHTQDLLANSRNNVGLVFGAAFNQLKKDLKYYDLVIADNYAEKYGDLPGVGELRKNKDSTDIIADSGSMVKLVDKGDMGVQLRRLLNNNLANAEELIFKHKRDWIESGSWGALLRFVPQENLRLSSWKNDENNNGGYPYLTFLYPTTEIKSATLQSDNESVTVNYTVTLGTYTGTATVLIAQYEGMQLVGVQLKTAESNALSDEYPHITVSDNVPFTVEDGKTYTYKAFLLDGSYAPLRSAVITPK